MSDRIHTALMGPNCSTASGILDGVDRCEIIVVTMIRLIPGSSALDRAFLSRIRLLTRKKSVKLVNTESI